MGGKSTKEENPFEYMDENTALETEFNNLKNCPDLPIVKCEFLNNSNKHWKVCFLGSDCSPYEDGYFVIEFIFKNTFPKNGPEAIFKTKMFHPNVNSDGHICINLLNNWDPKYSIVSVFYGILEIMDHPVASGGYSNEARNLLEKDEEAFYRKVEEYTINYAKKELF